MPCLELPESERGNTAQGQDCLPTRLQIPHSQGFRSLALRVPAATHTEPKLESLAIDVHSPARTRQAGLLLEEPQSGPASNSASLSVSFYLFLCLPWANFIPFRAKPMTVSV